MRIFHIVLILILFTVPAYGQTTTATSSGTITMDFDLSAHGTDKNTELWIPYPLSDEHQQITDIRLSGNYIKSAVYSDQKYSTPMLYAKWNSDTAGRKLSLSFHVTREEVIRRDFPEQEAAWNPADYSMYLQPTSLGPIDGVVKQLAEDITKDKKGTLAKAKAVYDWIIENMHRDPETRGCGPGDVCLLLTKPGGKCTDIHSVFVALCRTAGVPAREVFGIRQGKKSTQDITTWQHCWAEFYLPGYGWVPVDPADVLKMMLVHNLKLDDAQTKQYREYYWGAWDQYRVKLAVGRDIVLNPVQVGPPLNTFGYPYAEINGEYVDWLDPEHFQYTFTFVKDSE
ncbi:transglutaminase-like domain-containing protein [Desulfogranum japonicum]|uniref:transglutaminase-like domain-containing protein n=1 Tax=Desulfogranum japonicum TaxID=231447 RepID=UPI0003F7E4DD|nr:transglutaminase-like domain-containing protein [Desulfogranum japonicum]